MFSVAWASTVKEPKIVKVNDMLVYKNVSDSIYERLRRNNVAVECRNGDLVVPNNNLLLQDIINLHVEAKWKTISKDKDEIFWVFNKEKRIGIEFDSNKQLIVSIQLL
jgi:hypothetical protein